MKQVFYKWTEIYWKNTTRNEKLALLLVASLFFTVYVTMAAALYIIADMAWHKRLGDVVRGGRYTLCLLLFCGISFIVSCVYANWEGMAIAVAMAIIFVVAAFLRLVMTRAFFEKLIDLCCDLSILCAVIAVAEMMIFLPMDPEYRAASLFLNANYYATAVEMVILMAAYKLLRGKHGRRGIYYIGVIGLNLVGLFLSDCRTTILVLLVAIPVMMAMFHKFRELKWYGLFAFACLVMFCLAPEIFPRVDELTVDFGKRFSIWETAIAGIREHPLFGQGGMTYSHIFAALGGHKAPHAHNLLLDPLLNFGVVGIGFLLPYFVDIMKRAMKMYTEEIDKGRAFLIFTLAFATVVHGITDITIFWPQTFLLLAFVLSSVGIYERKPAVVWDLAVVRVNRKGKRTAVRGFTGCVSLQKPIREIEAILPKARILIEKPELWMILATSDGFNGKLPHQRRSGMVNLGQKVQAFNGKVKKELRRRAVPQDSMRFHGKAMAKTK